MSRMVMVAMIALWIGVPATARDFSAAEQRVVLRAAADVIEERYVDPREAHRVAAALRKVAAGRRSPAEGATFARETTEYLRKLSADGHLGLSYSETPIAEGDASGFTTGEMEKWYGSHLNHGVEKIERLDGNIMLVDLRVFPPPAMAGDVIAAMMTVVAQGDALIIDLRNNGGGAESEHLMMGYLVDGGSQLTGSFDRPSGVRRYESSPHWVPGRRFGSNKPLYVLTSRRTFSAAEAFAYDLQALKRATIVGEASGGGAHPFEYRRVHAHFAVDLPEGKSINPITGGNWQGVGVKPDVVVPADQALAKAIELARTAITDRSISASDPR